MRNSIAYTLTSAILFLLLSSCSRETVTDVSMLRPASFTYDRHWQPATLIAGTDTLTTHIRGRGHSTFRQPKHPYAVKLPKPQPLAGLPAHRNFILLANFFDHSLLRNALALEAARRTSLADVTPRWHFVKLTTDGQPQGLYLLTERVKDLIPQTDSLLQLDVYRWQEQREAHQPIDSLPAGIRTDTLSLIDWWLIHEVCMNAEPCGPRSCYFRITSDSVLKAGPAWDFDMAFNELGIDNGGDLRPSRFRHAATLPPFLQGKTITWLTVDSLYCLRSPILRPYISDPHFRALAARRWHQLRPHFRRLLPLLSCWSRTIRPYAEADQQRWNALEPARFDPSTSWRESVNHLHRTFRLRIKALDGIMKEWRKERPYP